MKTVIAAALGECVHVAGISNFLRLAEAAGWRTVFLGPAVSIEQVLEAARREQADLVGISYRLTPETGERLLGQLVEAASYLHEAGVRYAFGGTPPVAERARGLGFFEHVFDGSEPPEAVLAYLKADIKHPGQSAATPAETDFPQTTVDRIQWKSPFPLIRHHFGLPTLEATRQGIEKVAEAQVLDVVSLGIDQDAQENFFHPERQDPRRTGAGGVPVRTRENYRSLYAASRHGNYPLDQTAARTHLSVSVYLQMVLKPHITNVVGHTEAHHAATDEDVIEAYKLARRAIQNALTGQPDMTADPKVQARCEKLVAEAKTTLEAITALAEPGTLDPLTNPAVLARAVIEGILDAPHLRYSPFARGQVLTRIMNGACVAVYADGRPLTETERLSGVGEMT